VGIESVGDIVGFEDGVVAVEDDKVVENVAVVGWVVPKNFL
jgi:uncharacterized protein YkvS